MIERYPPSEMREGFNDNGEETVFYVSNPALGLWAVRERLMLEGEDADDDASGVQDEEKVVVEEDPELGGEGGGGTSGRAQGEMDDGETSA